MGPDEEIAVRISTAELERRWALARAGMAERGLDALVMQNANDWLGGAVKWFTDLPAANGYPRTVIFFARDPMTVVEMGPFDDRRELGACDPLHRGVGRLLCSPSFTSIVGAQSYDSRLVAEEIRRAGLRRVGLVGRGALPSALVEAVEGALPRAGDAVEASDWLDPIKAVKSDEEIALIRRAAAMQDAAFAEVCRFARPGMRDHEIAGVAWRACQAAGSEQGITLGRSAPLGRASVLVGRHRQNRVVEPGDHLSLLIETNGPGGFYTEIARTLVFGKASSELIDGFALVRELQTLTLRRMRPGVACAEIAEAHRTASLELGAPPERRLYSHGQGYDMVERPLIRHDETMALAARMNLAVHPGFETASIFAVICDNYLIGESGPTACLHATDKRIFELA